MENNRYISRGNPTHADEHGLYALFCFEIVENETRWWTEEVLQLATGKACGSANAVNGELFIFTKRFILSRVAVDSIRSLSPEPSGQSRNRSWVVRQSSHDTSMHIHIHT